MSSKEVAKNLQQHIHLAWRLEIPILTVGVDFLGRGSPMLPPGVEVCIERLTFEGDSETEFPLSVCVAELEAEGQTAVLVDKIAESDESLLFWTGWTAKVRIGQVLAVQRVIFPKPSSDRLLGEVDQGTLYEVRNDHLSPINGTAYIRAAAAA